ncbi:MAG: PAS domain S-box protein [Sphingomonadales bacterium]
MIKILLVHGDAAAQERVSCLLGDCGLALAVETAPDAASALRILDGASFDCLLVDHDAPPAGGTDLVRQVRRQWGGRGPAILMITPRRDTEAFVAAIEAGAQAGMFTEDGDPLSYRYGLLAAITRMRQERQRHEILAELEYANQQLSHANRALQESEQRFRGVFHTAPHGMALVSPDGRWLMVNPALCAMLGYSERELLAASFQTITHPDDLDLDLEYVRRMLAAEILSYRMEKRYIRKDGQEIWILLSVSLVRDDAGKPLHFVSEILDLTEIKEAQQELQQVQRLEAVGQLTGGVAHDFNNLLMAMQLNLEILATCVQDSEVGGESVRMLSNAVERGTQLTRQLLAFARRQPLDPKVVEVKALMEDVVAFISRTLREDIDIVGAFDADTGSCELDRGQFQNALLNLAINAADAMPRGGRLSFASENVTIGEETAASGGERISPGDYVVISVRDTGSGMPQSVVDRALEPFFTTKDVGKGTGLGLSMVYGFVKQSGGYIHIASEMNEGTAVHIYLPRIHRAPRPQVTAVPARRPAAPAGLERVLVVEDNEDVRRTLLMMLRKEGYTVKAASSGHEALAIVDEGAFRPQMLIADLVLPDRITGREVAEALLVRVPECRVLFMSGYAENVLVHGGRVDSGITLLNKPFSKADLLTRIGELMDRPGYV